MRRQGLWAWCITLVGVIAFVGFKAPSVGAFFEPQITKLIERFLPSKGNISVSADISLTPDGDVNKNNFIDVGDSVTIAYLLANTTTNDYLLTTLKTKIERSKIGNLRSIHGTTSLDDQNGLVNIPNINLKTNTTQAISFEATVVNGDTRLNADAELMNSDNQVITSTGQKSIDIKHNERELPSLIKRTQE